MYERKTRKKGKIVVAFTGGGGCKNLRRVMKKHKPADLPHFIFWGGNTDGDALDVDFPAGDSDVQAWDEVTTIYQYGEEGLGAGADPQVAYSAAMEDNSIAALKKVIEQEDVIEVVVGTCLGGGTGSGTAPVIAKVAVDAGKTTVAVVTMPGDEDHRDPIATEGLDKLLEICPVFAFYNSHLTEYFAEALNALQEGEEAWDVVNDNSVIPTVLLLNEIIAVPGNMKNMDRNDWKAACKDRKHGYLRKVTVTREMTAQQIVDQLCAGGFNNQAIVSVAKTFGFRFHGPFTHAVHTEVRRLMRQRASGGDTGRDSEISIHWGWTKHEDDPEMWVGMVALSDEIPTSLPSPSSTTDTANAVQAVMGKIRFIPVGKTLTLGFPVPLVLEREFKHWHGNINATEERLITLYDKVQAATVSEEYPEGVRPQMPAKYSNDVQVKKTWRERWRDWRTRKLQQA